MHFLIVLLSLITISASASIIQYPDGQGNLIFTDSVEKVPEKYRDRAIVVTPDPPLTIIDNQASPHFWNVPTDTVNNEDKCGPPYHVVRERRTIRENGMQKNVMFYVVKDICNREVSAYRKNPIPLFHIHTLPPGN